MRPDLLPRTLALATGMLTVIRVPVAGTASTAELRASTGLYPLVGVLVGLAPVLVLLLPFPPLVGAALAVAAWTAITGALHLDGWADCCDAAFAPERWDPTETRERRLAILKDSRTGAFGVVGLVLLLLLKVSALAAAPVVAPLFAAPAARWGMVWCLRMHPAARSEGLGAAFAGRVPLSPASGLLAAVLLGILALLLPPALWARPLLAVAVGLLAAAGIARFLAGRFGGMTGDVCGAVGEGTEVVVLLAWVAGA